MTSPNEVPLTLRDAGPPPDEIDGLLRAFFRAELPDPWPVLKPPADDENPVAVRKTGRTWAMMRSRLALAASIGLLLVGCWFLSGLRSERPLSTDATMSDPEATLRPFPLHKVRTQEGREVLMQGDVIREIEETTDSSGKPIQKKKPPTLLIKVQEVP